MVIQNEKDTDFKLFLQESREEFKRINWPTFLETQRLAAYQFALPAGWCG